MGGGETGGGSSPPFGIRATGIPGLQHVLLEFPNLVRVIRDGPNWSEHPFCYGGTVGGVGKGEDLFPDLRRKAQQAQDMCHPGAGGALLSGDLSLAGDLS